MRYRSGSGTVLDPDADSDGDGYSDAVEVEQGSDPMDGRSRPEGLEPDAPILEGGGGCECGPGTGPTGAAWPALALLGCLRRRRRRG